MTKRTEMDSHYLSMLSTVTRRWPAGRLNEAPTYTKGYDVTGINGNTVPGHSGFAHATEFFLKLSAILARAFKKFSQLCPRPKAFKQYRRPHVSARPFYNYVTLME
jgi:hypothetical protein